METWNVMIWKQSNIDAYSCFIEPIKLIRNFHIIIPNIKFEKLYLSDVQICLYFIPEKTMNNISNCLNTSCECNCEL